MTDTALVPSADVAALESVPVNEIDDALADAWHSFGRRTVIDGWHLGRALRRVKDGRGRHFRAYCESIGMNRSWAYRLLKIADAPEPTATTAPSRNGDQGTAATDDRPPVEAVEATPAAVVEAVAAEATPDPAALREGRLERLAIITEHLDGDVVDAWADRFDRQAAREREHVAANRASAKRERAWKRERADICDAMLTLPPSPEVDALLAKFFNVAGKAA